MYACTVLLKCFWDKNKLRMLLDMISSFYFLLKFMQSKANRNNVATMLMESDPQLTSPTYLCLMLLMLITVNIIWAQYWLFFNIFSHQSHYKHGIQHIHRSRYLVIKFVAKWWNTHLELCRLKVSVIPPWC